jgi:anti-sigma regulatory factor (Ser/Thr protein kinase)
VAQAAGLVGLSVIRVADLLLVVSELTTNAVCHGGGSGHLELWSVNNRLHCLITDQGPGIPPERANIADVPLAYELSGRGIWLARKLADSLSIVSSSAGTAIHVSMII